MVNRTRIHFLGAARTVTGSRFLVETGTSRVLVDCGMFQGTKELRLRNWAGFPVDPARIDALVVSHAHLDHVGYVPALVRQGFSGPIHASVSTERLADTVLRDSGRLHEADAERANRKGYTKHKPALPLYTEDDAIASMRQFVPSEFGERRKIADGVWMTLRRAGHILGSASIVLEFDNGSPPVLFSGDLGRSTHPILLPPDPPIEAGTVVMESTYGDQEHVEEDGTVELGRVIAATIDRGGAVVIPAFAVDRTEIILHSLRTLTRSGAIPEIPVYLDSPMARSALGFYLRAVDEGHPEVRPEVAGHPEIFDPGDLTITESVEDSKAINLVHGPHVIISASGMATGGRVLHHLKRLLPDRRNTVILVGYQAIGTRGQSLLSGADTVRIHGDDVPVGAEIASVPAFSVHADRSELLDWLATAPHPPERVIAVHGDDDAATSLIRAIRTERGWHALAPSDGEVVAV
jgi:metallo-beta-lactamase family protein